jgi:hypothetical protein
MSRIGKLREAGRSQSPRVVSMKRVTPRLASTAATDKTEPVGGIAAKDEVDPSARRPATKSSIVITKVSAQFYNIIFFSVQKFESLTPSLRGMEV